MPPLSAAARRKVLEKLMTTPERRAWLESGPAREAIEKIAASPATKRVHLFGSVVSDKPNPRDIDIIVEGKRSASVKAKEELMRNIAEARVFGVNADVYDRAKIPLKLVTEEGQIRYGKAHKPIRIAALAGALGGAAALKPEEAEASVITKPVGEQAKRIVQELTKGYTIRDMAVDLMSGQEKQALTKVKRALDAGRVTPEDIHHSTNELINIAMERVNAGKQIEQEFETANRVGKQLRALLGKYGSGAGAVAGAATLAEPKEAKAMPGLPSRREQRVEITAQPGEAAETELRLQDLLAKGVRSDVALQMASSKSVVDAPGTAEVDSIVSMPESALPRQEMVSPQQMLLKARRRQQRPVQAQPRAVGEAARPAAAVAAEPAPPAGEAPEPGLLSTEGLGLAIGGAAALAVPALRRKALRHLETKIPKVMPQLEKKVFYPPKRGPGGRYVSGAPSAAEEAVSTVAPSEFRPMQRPPTPTGGTPHLAEYSTGPIKVSPPLAVPPARGSSLREYRAVAPVAAAGALAASTAEAAEPEMVSPQQMLQQARPQPLPLEAPQIVSPRELLSQARTAPPLTTGEPERPPVVNEGVEVAEEDRMPWWQDLSLAGVAYGLAGAGAAMAPVPPVSATLLAAAGGAALYLGARHAMGEKPRGLLTEAVPEEYRAPTAIAEEFGLAAAAPYVLKYGMKGAVGLLKGVDKYTHATGAAVSKLTAPIIDQLWDNVIVRPMNIQLPGIKKSVADMLQPAVERLAKTTPQVAQTFRHTSAMKSLATEAGETLRHETSGLLPSESYEVMKGLRGTPASQLTSGKAKSALDMFDKRLTEAKLDTRYENTFRDEVSKLLTKPIESVETALGPGAVMSTLKTLERGLTGRDTKAIHTALQGLMDNPAVPNEMKVFAKDIWNLNARSAAEVADAARKASTEYLVDRLTGYPGLVSARQLPGYVESQAGKLKGLYMPKDVELELQALHQVPMISRGFFQKWLMSPWKTGKVLLRPATHIRNLISNTILNDWGGLPFYRVDMYVKALKEMRNNGQMWKELRQATGLGGTFAQQEVYQLEAGLKYGATLMDRLYAVYDKAVRPARSLFQAEESWFKLAKYMHNKELGMSKADSVIDAMKWTFNYAEITPELAQIRKYAMPFATWYSKSIPLMAETAVKHPVRFWKWVEFGRQLQSYGLQSVGLGEEEWQGIEKVLPEYMRKGLYLMMPWRDEQQRLNLLNLTYIIPGIGDLSEYYQRSVPEMVMQNPFVTTAGTLLSKRKYSGAPLYHDWEEPGTKAAKAFSYVWEQMMPAVVPGGTDWNSLYRSITDQTGEAPSPEQALAGMFGFKLTPVDPEAHARRTEAVKRIHEAEMAVQQRKELKAATSEEEANSILTRYQRIREKAANP